jgi:very-long-chain enoyl-CoA reductase
MVPAGRQLTASTGAQLGWRTVYVIEYLGPLVIHPAFYYLRPYLYPWPSLTPNNKLPPPSQLQTLCMVLITLHFLKRELETIFVHRFSAATMPAFNVIKNSGHYWFLSGLNIAYWIYAPTSAAQTTEVDPRLVYAMVGLYTIAELGNLNTHLVLRNLRRPGSTDRGVPQGLGFGVVTCPNYMFEVIAWVAICVLCRSLGAVLFLVVATTTMAQWGWKRERRYRKEFPDKYKKKRYAILPGLV